MGIQTGMKSVDRSLFRLLAIIVLIAVTTDAQDTSYRLPTTVRPSRYDLDITPYFETADGNTEFTFDGIARITLRATVASVRTIILHINDLEISSFVVGTLATGTATDVVYNATSDFWTITLSADLPTETDTTVVVNYMGYMREDMAGFYRSYYIEGGERVYMGATQFQATSARRAFPCFDVRYFDKAC